MLKQTSGATLVASILFACTASGSLEPGEEILVLEVAAEKAPCVGEMQTMCLQVRAPGEEDWRNFYDPIEGFEHEAGVRYTLEVARREVENPPADGSSYAYRLLRILEERRPGQAGHPSVDRAPCALNPAGRAPPCRSRTPARG